MDLMARLFGMADGGTPGPTADYWYRPVGTMTDAGVRIDADAAKKISAWFRGREILSNMLAMLPMQVMELLPEDGGSQPARDHALYDVLHGQPNDFQDSFEWRREHMYDLIDFGWAYDWILPGARGFADQLVPIDPRLVTPKPTYRRLANGAVVQGRWLFEVKDPQTSAKTTFTQDDIFYRRSASGKGILEHARGSLGTATATESYAATVFSKGVLNGGVIENPGLLNADAARRMALSFVTAAREWHMPKVLEQGSKWVESKMSPEDAQMLASRQFTVDDIARWLGVPRMMLENSDPSYGNGEQFTQNFLDINMGGWLMLWESASNTQLIVEPDQYFVRLNRKAIVRSNFKDLVDGHVALVNAGIESVDEARAVEDMPKRGGKADELREPQNITGKPAAPPPEPVSDAPPQPDASAAFGASAKAEAIAQASAARVLRKEVTFVQKSAVRHAANADAFATEIAEFYAKHVALVADTLQMATADAETYCAGQAHQILNGEWVQALALWQTEAYAAGLAAIALEEVAA
jgi:HK97 family phage portal protein